MIITIGGTPGSGKTTAGKILANKLGYNHFSTGDLRGQMAMDRGITIDELNKIGETEDWTDKQADEKMKEVGETKDDVVVDAWLGFHFIPSSFKVLLKTSFDIGARRVFKKQRPDEEKHVSIQGVKDMLNKRYETCARRYKKWYGLENIYDESNYDLVIDTTNISANETAERIIESLPK